MAKGMKVFVEIGGRVAGSFTSAVDTVEGRLKRLSRTYTDHAKTASAAVSQVGAALKGVASLAAAGGIAFTFKHAFEGGEELADDLQGLKNAGRTAGEVADGLSAAYKTIAAMPTASLTNSIKLLNETTGAYGDYKHAVENLPFNSKMGDVLKYALHVQDPAHQTGSFIKALEIRGSAGNPEQYRREAEGLSRAMVFYGGRLKADDIYTFASNASVGIKQLNERFLTKIAPALIQEMGGDKAGTGLTAFRTVISGRKISKIEQAQEWQKLGLLDKAHIQINKKTGNIKGWDDGAIKDTALAYRDPLAFIERDILPKLQTTGVDINDPIKLGGALNKLFQNTKANAFVTAISTVVDRARLKKDEGLIDKVPTLDKIYDGMLDDPKVAQDAVVTAMGNIGKALTLPMMKPFAQVMIGIARAANQLGAALGAHPEAARIVTGTAMALSGLAAIRLADAVLGISGTASAVGSLVVASGAGAAAKIIEVSRALWALSLATMTGAAGRLKATVAGVVALNEVGGVGAVLAAVGTSVLSFGRAVFLFPLTALRSIGAALLGLLELNPVAVVVTGLVVALTSLGVWVYNNAGGIATMFEAFGKSFMKALGPEAAGDIGRVADGLKAAWEWVTKLLGPIDETGKKWTSWGESAGTAAGKVVAALIGLPGKIAEVAKTAWDALVNFDWAAAGAAIVQKIGEGITSFAGSLANAVTGAASRAVDAVKGVVGLGAATAGADAGAGAALAAAPATSARQAAPTPPHLGRASGSRALGGPVAGGRTYLVGERGPELFTPAISGAITSTNRVEAALKGDGTVRIGVDATAVARAGETARASGEALRSSLAVTVRPVVDTSSIDAATEKLNGVHTMLASLGSDSINLGGGLGGAASAAVHGAGRLALARRGGPLDTNSKGADPAVVAYVREAAIKRGIDPNVAVAVGNSEGLRAFDPNRPDHGGDRGTSFGPFQLHYKNNIPGLSLGGLGDSFTRATGLSARDSGTWKAQVDYALDQAKRGGWTPWHGAANTGIHRWQGIAGARAGGGPVGRGLPYLVGEHGPEIFTPGASGHISTNGVLARLVELGRMAVEGTGEGLAPSAAAVRKLRAGEAPVQNVRGDTHFHGEFHIHEANNPAAVRRQVEASFRDLVREFEDDQRGLLSD